MTDVITADEFDRLFDDGNEDVLQYFDTANPITIGEPRRTLALELPQQTFGALEKLSSNLGLTPKQLAEQWLHAAASTAVL